MAEKSVECARPTGGPVGENPEEAEAENIDQKEIKKERAMLMVGQKVPDFTAPGYPKGTFVNIKLSDYLCKWVLLWYS